MKLHLLFLTFFLLVSNCNSFAQTIYNSGLDLYVNPNTGNLLNRSSDVLIDNMIRMNQQQIQNNIDFTNMLMMNQLLLNAAKENIGRAKLKVGQATTRITFVPANSMVADITASNSRPEENKI